jgi:hypothetical protein
VREAAGKVFVGQAIVSAVINLASAVVAAISYGSR